MNFELLLCNEHLQCSRSTTRQIPAAVRKIIGTFWNVIEVLSRGKCLKTWWPGTESNRRRQPFQGCALPTELPGQVFRSRVQGCSFATRQKFGGTNAGRRNA